MRIFFLTLMTSFLLTACADGPKEINGKNANAIMLVTSSPFGSVYAKSMSCDTILADELDVTVDLTSSIFADDEKQLERMLSRAVGSAVYWPERLPCSYSRYKGRGNLLFRGEAIGTVRFQSDKGTERIKVTSLEIDDGALPDEPDALSSFLSAFRDGEYNEAGKTNIEAALDDLAKVKPKSNSGPSKSLIEGQIYQYAGDWETREKSISILEDLSKKGSAEATLSLFAYRPFDNPVSKVSSGLIKIEKGEAVTLNDDVFEGLEREKGLIARAEEQNVGYVHSLKRKLTEYGFALENGTVKQTGTTLPKRKSIEIALLRSLEKDNPQFRDYLDTQLRVPQIKKISTFGCDDDWCNIEMFPEAGGMSFTYKMRASLTKEPVCTMIKKDTAHCSFSFKPVLRVETENDDLEILNIIQRKLPKEHGVAEGKLKLKNGRWEFVRKTLLFNHVSD